jgi:hypothetical protein
VQVEIPKATVQQAKVGASGWQICYASTQTFPAVTGTTGTTTVGGTTYNTGQLLSCQNTPVAPCVLSRTKDNAGDVLVTFLALGDPLGKGVP